MTTVIASFKTNDLICLKMLEWIDIHILMDAV